MAVDLRRPIPSSTAAVVVDVQARLLGVMQEAQRSRMVDNLLRLGAATEVLGVHRIITEQYPKGLGPTVPLVKQAFDGAPVHDKLTFDALGAEAVVRALEGSGAKDVIVAGMETHICVFQTVRSLVERDYRVFLLADAVASRTADNRARGLALAEAAGAIVTSTETVLFDLLERAGSEAFRAISKLVR